MRFPVSKLMPQADGSLPSGTAAFEKRGIAVEVPVWLPENCIQCNRCSYVCPHAVIRPFVMNDEELKNAPEGTKSTKMLGKGTDGMHFSIAISPMDCTGCGSCINVCPAKNKALASKPLAEAMGDEPVFEYATKKVTEKPVPSRPAPSRALSSRRRCSSSPALRRLRRNALCQADHPALW